MTLGQSYLGWWSVGTAEQSLDPPKAIVLFQVLDQILSPL